MKTFLHKTNRSIIIVFALCAIVSAQDKNLLPAIKAKYGGGTPLSVTFDCTIYWKVREKEEKKKGTLILVPGEKFRLRLGSWEWVCDGHTYWQYNEKTAQVQIQDLHTIDMGQHPSQMMKRYLGYSFGITSQTEKEVVYSWRDTSATPSGAFSAITLWVDVPKKSIRKIVAVDGKGNESTYTFNKTLTGKAVPQETFVFNVPQGVDVVDTRKK